jgi:hypothetical protein
VKFRFPVKNPFDTPIELGKYNFDGMDWIWVQQPLVHDYLTTNDPNALFVSAIWYKTELLSRFTEEQRNEFIKTVTNLEKQKAITPIFSI